MRPRAPTAASPASLTEAMRWKRASRTALVSSGSPTTSMSASAQRAAHADFCSARSAGASSTVGRVASLSRPGLCGALHPRIGPRIRADADESQSLRSFNPGRLGLAPRLHDSGHLVAECCSIGDGLGADGLEHRGASLGDEHGGPGTGEAGPSGRAQHGPVLCIHVSPQDARTQIEDARADGERAPQGQRRPGGDGEQCLGAVFPMFVDTGDVDAGQGVDALLLETSPRPRHPVGHREQALLDAMPAGVRVGHDEHPG